MPFFKCTSIQGVFRVPFSRVNTFVSSIHLSWMRSEYTCFLYNIVPRDTRLGRLYKVSAECTTKRKSLTYWGDKSIWFPLLRRRGESNILFHALIGASLFTHFTGKPLIHFSWSLISAILLKVFNPPPHFRNLSTNQSILVLSLLNIFTVFNTRAHTANQNVYGLVKDDHVVTILFVLTFSEMNIEFRFL